MTSAKKTRGRKRTLFCFARAGVGLSSPAFPAPRFWQSRMPAGSRTGQRLYDTEATLTDRRGPPHDPRVTLRGERGRHRAVAGRPFSSSPAVSPLRRQPCGARALRRRPPLQRSSRRRPAVTLPSPLCGTRGPQQPRPATLPPSLFLSSRLPGSSTSRMRNRPGTTGKRSRAASVTAPFSPRRRRNCTCAGPPPPFGRYRPLCRGARYPGQRYHSGDWPREPRGGTRGAR